MDSNYRLEKYLGWLAKVDNFNQEINKNHLAYVPENFPSKFLNTSYTQDFNAIGSKLIKDYLFLVIFGDVRQSFNFPVITKTRLIDDIDKNILLYLNSSRHWDYVWTIKKHGGDPIPWNKKTNKGFWRGALTGRPDFKNLRLQLIEKFINNKKTDVGFTNISQYPKLVENKNFLKKEINIFEMLKYKYLISIEGNDVATNLKWIMSSKSLTIMPIPKVESWFLESELKPWKHFVPINDNLNDLEEKIEWCNDNQKECKEIVFNANCYVDIFLNKKNEIELSKKILQKYIEKIKFYFTDKITKETFFLNNKKNVSFKKFKFFL